MSSIQGLLYTHGIATQAASHGVGGQGIGVRGVLDSIPGGTTPFLGCQFQMRSATKG